MPPNLGILMLRFPVGDIDALETHIDSEGIDVVVRPVAVVLPPYGSVRLIAIRGPGGVWIEFFEQM